MKSLHLQPRTNPLNSMRPCGLQIVRSLLRGLEVPCLPSVIFVLLPHECQGLEASNLRLKNGYNPGYCWLHLLPMMAVSHRLEVRPWIEEY